MPGAGTDKTKRWHEGPAPVVILVEPQLGVNIGAQAPRAWVKPRPGRAYGITNAVEKAELCGGESRLAAAGKPYGKRVASRVGERTHHSSLVRPLGGAPPLRRALDLPFGGIQRAAR
jgi:hypothetical protein